MQPFSLPLGGFSLRLLRLQARTLIITHRQRKTRHKRIKSRKHLEVIKIFFIFADENKDKRFHE